MAKGTNKVEDEIKEELLIYQIDDEIEQQIEKEITDEKNYNMEANYVSGKDSFSMYLDDIGNCKPVLKEEEINLFRRLKNGDESAREEIFRANARLVIFVAKKYSIAIENNPAIDFEDLVSVGNMGLFKAISLFNEELGYKFSTYAYNWIYSYIERHLVNHSSAIRIPAHIQEKIRIVNKRKKKFELLNGRDLTVEEEDKLIREVVGTSEPAIRMFKFGYNLSDVISLNAKLQKGDESEESEYLDFVESRDLSPDEECNLVFMSEELNKFMDECLTQRQAEVLRYRFGFVTGSVMTLDQVGKIFGVTRERIRQIESKAIRVLRNSRKGRHLKEYLNNL